MLQEKTLLIIKISSSLHCNVWLQNL